MMTQTPRPLIPHKLGARVRARALGRVAKVIACVIGLAMPFAARGETIIPPPKHATRISLDQGLSQSTVSAILQARDGCIWFATGDGVSIFDGVSFNYLFRQFGARDGLQSNYARTIFQDASGAIWVGTLGGGISKFDETGTHLANFLTADKSLPSDDVFSITQSPDGAIWAATAAGVARLLPDETTFVRIYSLPRAPAKSLLALPDGTLLIGTQSEGLIRLSPAERTTIAFTTDNSALPANSITALFQDRSGHVWIGMESDGAARGLARFIPETNVIETPIALPDPDVEAIAEGFDGRLWFGTWSSGLFIWDPITGTLENHRARPANPQRLASDTILALAPDRTGRMWAGTYDAGAASLSQFPDRFTSFTADPTGIEGPRSGVIWALANAPGRALWVGTKEGLSLLDRGTNRFTDIPLRPDQPSDIRALLPEPEGLLIAARPQGLLRLDPATKTARPITAPDSQTPLFANEFIRLLMRDRQGRLWVGTTTGLALLAPDFTERARFHGTGGTGDLPSPRIRGLYESPDGTIWVGTSAGLARYLPASNSFETLSGPAVLPDNDVRAVLQIDPETLLIATGGGLSKLDLPSQTARFIQRSDGLPNETLYSLIPDAQGDIWITTNNGLARYTPQTDTIQSFHTRDGLAGNEFNFNAFAALEDGTIAVGGVNGLALFDPAHLAPNTLPPITSLRVLALEDNAGAQSALSLTIGLRHYDEPKANLLRWRLDPIDTAWSQAQGPTHLITRDALPAGDYTLRFVALSAGGAAAPEQQFQFNIAQSPFKTWYAYLGYAITLGAALAGIFQLRVAQISRRNKLLRAQVSEQTRALEEANALLKGAAEDRARFYSRAAHEIRTPLSLIKAPLQKILASPTLETNERRLLQMVERASKRMLHLIDEMAAVAQDRSALPSGQSTVDVDRFIAPILALYRDAAAENGQSLRAEHHGPLTATLDITAAETILHNLLSNAVRHAPKASAILLETRLEGAALMMRVANEGAPLSAATLARLTAETYPPMRGLELIGAALKRAEGTLRVDPDCPDITITLPATFQPYDPAPESRAARILIVEDDADLREYLVTLTTAIAAPTAVGSLKAARRAVLRGNFELVICDVLLPDGSGFDFAQTLKTTAETSHIGIVFLTALADPASYRQGLRAWADDYLTKPFDAEDLISKLRILLRARDRLRAHLSDRSTALAAPETELVPLDHRFLASFKSYLDAHYPDPNANLMEAAKHCAMSKRALQRKLEMLFGKGFATLLKDTRMDHASAMLRAGLSVTQTAERCGYASLASFSRQFKDQFDQSPRAYRTAPPEQESNG